MTRPGLVTDTATVISQGLHISVASAIPGVGLPILFPVVRIFLFPAILAFSFVDAIVRICLQFFSFPFGLSCLLAPLVSTVSLVLDPRVPGTNPPAAGTAKGNGLHDFLPGLVNLLQERKAQKEKTKEKIKENLTDKQQREEKRRK